ncbi:MAG: DUF1015 domain-containing protein [Lachnospiraceae bacterium]|nr:DUF1015 domain-containing protein [Lachnospiraceae bacterium]
MADIRAFRGIRPRWDLANVIAALPYDVYNREEATKVVADNPMSFLSIDRAETAFGPETDTYADEVYKKAHDLLWERVEKGDFVKDDKPCLYLYELEMKGHVQTGIVACASIDDYLNDVIKKHENTRADKERDRIRHVDTCGAQTGPIFLAYKENKKITDIINKIKVGKKPINNFTSDDGVRHTVTVIDDDATIKEITDLFRDTKYLYIADGHHRAASAVKAGLMRREANGGKAGEYDYFLSVLFADTQLSIMDYNRIVHDLNGNSPEAFLKKVRDIADVAEIATKVLKPAKRGECTMYLGHKWYRLVFKEKYLTDDPVEGMDVSILQNNILAPILDIDDPKTNERIEFVGGIRGLDFLEKHTDDFDSGVAFAMYPVSMKELFDVADAGLLMPPKSTWFEPKLRSGLFIHEI